MTASGMFDSETVIKIHDTAIARFGGEYGIRDIGLLEAALAQPFQGFGGVELYPTDAEKAARYAFEIVRNHPFVDGNKRTAAAVMGSYLRLCGHNFKPRHDELFSAIYLLASGEMGYGELAEWVRQQL